MCGGFSSESPRYLPVKAAVKVPLRFWTRALVRASTICLVICAACRDTAAPTEQPATFTGHWAGKPWAGQASALVARGGAAGDTLYVFGTQGRAGQGYTDQYVRVRALVTAPGTYALSANAAEVVDLLG